MSYPIDEGCIFCKIISGVVPCAKIYEDVNVIAFLDINPIVQGHALVVPKGHYATLLDLPDDVGAPLLSALRLVGGAVQNVTGATGFNCIQNNFRSAGQVIFHTHWHVIPRFDRDGLSDWPAGQYPDMAVMQELASAISNCIYQR